ncbi:MAG: XdhC family protein [Actinomycetota bacterium]|nr:XdhC family protein [Actinomycetota bacterium]
MRVPYVHARVVLAQRPTSAKPGDQALVLPDGSMEGFVGGDCAESTVRAQSLALLDSGDSLLLRITPEPEAEPQEAVAGTLSVHNPCLSGGTLEIFLEPRRPPPLVVVEGDTPIARALLAIGRPLGYELVRHSGALPADAAAVVVASHGRDEADLLREAVAAQVPYIGLVASPKRGSAVVASLDLEDQPVSAIHTPAGLDIGARTPEEIALSILADIVARRPRPTGRTALVDPSAGAAAAHPPVASQASDPVCGMTVAAVDSSLHLEHDGTRYYFCGSGCLRAFAADPAGFGADGAETVPAR